MPPPHFVMGKGNTWIVSRKDAKKAKAQRLEANVFSSLCETNLNFYKPKYFIF
jgi:hypothetical protein